MAIIPPFVLELVQLHLEPLALWFSQRIYEQLLAKLEDELLVCLQQHFDFTVLEQVCAAYRHTSGPGRPPMHQVSVLVRMLLLMYLFNWSLRKTEYELRTNLLVRWFVGLPVLGTVPDHTELCRFDGWVLRNCPWLFFRESRRQVDQAFPGERHQVQIGDTFAMLARAADEHNVRRLRHLCEYLLCACVEALPNEIGPLTSGVDWLALFGPPDEHPAIFKDETRRNQCQRQVVLATLDLKGRIAQHLSNYSNQQFTEVRRWLILLDKVIQDEFELQYDAQGQAVGVRELPNDKKGDFRLISATDPDATLRVHGDKPEDAKLGYNVQVAITPAGFVREIQAYTGAVPDQSTVANLISAQVEQYGVCPPKLIYDRAGGSGKVRAEVHQASNGLTQLVALLPDYQRRCDRFGPYDFTLSADGQVLTCPNGKSTCAAYNSGSGDGRNFRFYAFQCWECQPPKRWKGADLSLRCPLWEQCRDSKQGPGSTRQVFVSDYRNFVLEARDYNKTEAFVQDMKLRPLVERVIFELTHYNGARHCRKQGEEKADFQAKMNATAYNLKHWMRLLSPEGKRKRRHRPAMA